MGECFFWCQLTRVVSDKGHKMVVVVVVVVIVFVSKSFLSGMCLVNFVLCIGCKGITGCTVWHHVCLSNQVSTPSLHQLGA